LRLSLPPPVLHSFPTRRSSDLPALRGDSGNGIGRWTEEEIVSFLKHGRNKHGVVFGSMMEAFNNSTQFMTDEDLQAIAHYLKSLDRKSTRLNSSHVKISYAVFC